ncbi:LWR-salt protein [Halorussus gelatinilyticus]|uniref:LWR-salt protein n=1 Tax=Halorussus gelatinilyticus TaxID=2937524 RepID=A0A8U0IJR3_9EURY|nr:LWR-salt protein [Halorussus gelatinilyticus]UPW00891.1 LWR-salt protein [Halorussus gelatinilyticus]
MDARYVFAVRFRLDPTVGGVSVEPNEFETRLSRDADLPGEEGWLFFRDNLWRGEINDERHFRRLTEEALDATVLSVEYRAFETDEEYLDALKDEIGADLATFNDDSVSAVLNKYLGSSIEVQE